ncbi:MAG TPA: hypothetical protein VN712_05135 [Dermatophilaceae bacterium]|nr:hypothetical protein [Dermatophilaceae bacterium]
MSVIGTEAINEYRGMGYSWRKAIRSSIEPKAWLGCRLYDTGCAIAKAGDAIGHAGDHLHGLCGCKD